MRNPPKQVSVARCSLPCQGHRKVHSAAVVLATLTGLTGRVEMLYGDEMLWLESIVGFLVAPQVKVRVLGLQTILGQVEAGR